MRPYDPQQQTSDDGRTTDGRPLPTDLDMSDPAWPNRETSPVPMVTTAGTIGSIGPDVGDVSSAPDSGAPAPDASPATLYRAKAVPADAIDVTPADRQLIDQRTDSNVNGNSRGDADNTGDTQAIRADIEHTRSQMSATIDAIQEKLNPQNLVDQAKGAMREATIGRVENMVSEVRNTAQEAGNGLMDTIKENPVPAALAAVGIGWLFMKSRNNTQNKYRYAGYNDYGPNGNYPRSGLGDRYDYRPLSEEYDRSGGPGEMVANAQDKVGDAARQVKRKVGDTAGQVRDAVGNAAGSVGDAAGGLVDNAQERVGDIGTGLQYGAERAQNSLQRMLYENPLALGAAALVAGAAIGMMLPETQPEHRLMGEARDTVMDKAQEVAQDTMGKVSRVAEQASNTAKQEAKNQGLSS